MAYVENVPVSVVVPCYCCQETVERALNSVSQQTWKPAEVILVDDASTDDTYLFLKSLSKKYTPGWIKVVHKNKNEGPAAARNTGWEMSAYPYIAFLDADDSWHSCKIEIQLKYMQDHPEIAITGNRWLFVKERINALPVSGCFSIRSVSYKQLLFSNLFSSSAVMLKRILPYRFNAEKRFSEDYLLWLIILYNGYKGAFIDVELTYLHKYPYGEGGLSGRLWDMEKGELDTYRRLHKEHCLSLPGLIFFGFRSFLKYLRRLWKVKLSLLKSRGRKFFFNLKMFLPASTKNWIKKVIMRQKPTPWQPPQLLPEKADEIQIYEEYKNSKNYLYIPCAKAPESLAGDVEDSFGSLLKPASIIIVTYNNVILTEQCITSIYKNTAYPDFELIIVDNASTDGTRDYLDRLVNERENVKVILNENNKGFAGGNNQGIQAAKGDYIVLLNNDTIVTPGWLGKLISILEKNKTAGMLGPTTNYSCNEAMIKVDYKSIEEMERFAGGYAAGNEGVHFEVDMLAMFCVIMRRRTIEEVGLLDDRFGTGMFEDDDYAMRVKERGYKILCTREVYIHHYGKASFKQISEDKYFKLFDENRKKFEKKWSKKWIPPR